MLSFNRKGRVLLKVNVGNSYYWLVEPLRLRLSIWGIP
nr:MAG TPA: hypothetical protein [Bacteriophage sp.]